MRLRGSIAAFVLALWGLACSPEVPVPGDELLGAFRMEARVLESACASMLQEEDLPASGGFAFDVILSREKETGHGFLTLNGISRDGGVEGQVFSSSYEAPRHFRWKDARAPCANTGFLVAETLRVVMLSASQDQLALGGRCPENASPLLEPGGAPVDVDAGIVPPEARPEGFDVQRLCGFLIDDVLPAAECGMPACRVVYGVEGVRRK